MGTNRRTALITGGSRGIGYAIAKRLHTDGIEVMAPSRTEMDLLSDSSIDAYMRSVREPVDILINNAGINVIASLTEIADRDLQDTMQIDLLAPLRLAKALAPRMMERRYGRIVNIKLHLGCCH